MTALRRLWLRAPVFDHALALAFRLAARLAVRPRGPHWNLRSCVHGPVRHPSLAWPDGQLEGGPQECTPPASRLTGSPDGLEVTTTSAPWSSQAQESFLTHMSMPTPTTTLSPSSTMFDDIKWQDYFGEVVISYWESRRIVDLR
jgi:hypothetical protein